MEVKMVSRTNHQPSNTDRILPALVPVLLTSIGYVDPGKWAATIDGGARFGLDLVVLMLVFNCAAILCQYLSARIAVVTGRNLAEICSNEYDKVTCILLGVQTEISVIALDLTMVLGIAHGLNLILGLDLLTSVLLTTVDAILFPFFFTLLENYKGRFVCIYMAGFIMFLYVMGVLVSQPEISLSMNGMMTKLNGESAFALMSLLGANILPHNFYLHSSIVQQYQEPQNVSKDTSCHDHFFAILTIFSGIFVANFVLMNSAAAEFYSTGLVLVNFQDAMSLMDQVFRNPIAQLMCLLVLLISNQITALNWKFTGQVISNNFLGINISAWVHRASIRTISILLALYCGYNSGAEGLYQLLIFTQVFVALLLPSSVIPLLRVATSRPIMGSHKISQILEFFSLITFIGILGLNIIFIAEMIVGSSDWVSNLRWNMGNSSSASYVLLLCFAITSFCLMLWLAATPLKSASAKLDTHAWEWDPQNVENEPIRIKSDVAKLDDAQVWDWNVQNIEPEILSEFKEKDVFLKNVFGGRGEAIQKQAPLTSLETDFTPEINNDYDLPETIIGSEPEPPPPPPHLSSIKEDATDITVSSSSICDMEESSSSWTVESVINSTVSGGDVLDPPSTVKIENSVKLERDLDAEKDDEERDAWEPEETSKEEACGGTRQPTLSYDGPGSFRSLGGGAKNEEGGGGSGGGSLSRLAGLGRAARRQLAAVLDEFWGQLYDFHGQPTNESKAKKTDALLAGEFKQANFPLKVDTGGTEFTGFFPSAGVRGTDSLYDSSKQQRVQSGMESSPYGIQRGPSSLRSNHMQLLDAYVQNSSRNIIENGERRYASLRVPPSSVGWDNHHQPITVHGYQISSFISRTAQEQNVDFLNSQMTITPPKSSTLLPTTNYGGDSLSFALRQKTRNGSTPLEPPGFQNVPRNNPIQSQRSYYDVYSSATTTEKPSNIPDNTKKYCSMPNISRISASFKDSSGAERNTQWDRPIGYNPSNTQRSYEQFLYNNNTGSKANAPLAFDELSPSKVYKDAFSFQLNSGPDTKSMWARQPFEQFGVAERPQNLSGENGSKLMAQESTPTVNVEVKLLTSFRHCILKLLKLEGSEWLFKQNDGADEDLVDRVAARERFLCEIETREMNREGHVGPPKPLVSSVPHCGEGCVWKVDLVTSFGVWCIHRILDLSLMESRPELWGKYTYVLNRLQGIIDLAYSKPRIPSPPCFCLQIPITHQQRSSPPVTNGMLPPASKPGKGKCTNASTLLDIVKDVEIAISCRKGRTGTAAGDVAFPKGKENLASVLKRYKRRLSNKLVAANESGGPGLCKIQVSSPYGL